MILSLAKSLGLVLLFVTFSHVNAEETAPPTDTTEVQTAPAPEKASTWNELLQKKYNLTDAQMTLLADSKLAEPQMAMAAQLAKSSNKPLEEILKMQSEKKMGWGQLAKELGVAEKELGQAVSALKRERNEERKRLKEEKHERKEKKEHKDKKERPEMKEKKERAEHPAKKDK